MLPSIMDDTSDLTAWIQHHDEAAFARIVQRHAALVSGICRRRLGNNMADETSQAVFIVLARRAKRITDASRLAGWLHGVAIRVCREAHRTASRRAKHERQAAAIGTVEAIEDGQWNDLRPYLDEAIATLSAPQQEAVIGHFLEGQTQTAVAERLGISEDAAHQRIHYALGKLRAWFGKRGMTVSLGALAVGLASEVHAAEPIVIATCTQAALHPVSATGAAALADGSCAVGAGKVTAGLTIGLLVTLVGGIVLWQAALGRRSLFTEDFELDGRLTSGWYDNTSFIPSQVEHAPGSGHAAEYRFQSGAEAPLSGGPSRRAFPASDAINLAYWVKYGDSWEISSSSGLLVQFLVMTTADGAFDAPSYTHLTCAIGLERGVPFVSLQDAKNIDSRRIGVDLAQQTEERAIAGGNGGEGGVFRRQDGTWSNVTRISAPKAQLSDGPGPFCKSDWHHVEVRLRLNRIVDGQAVSDGHLAYLVDDQVVLERQDVVFRTAQNADMRFNQFIIGPWSDGSPVEQVFWIDDLALSIGTDDRKPPITPPTP